MRSKTMVVVNGVVYLCLMGFAAYLLADYPLFGTFVAIAASCAFFVAGYRIARTKNI